MIEISTIRDLVTIFGVIAGFSYYVLTVRNAQRNQQQQLEARKAQFFSQIYSWFIQTESLVEYMEILNWEWTDYDDFEKKYGSDNNLRGYAVRTRVWSTIDMLGKYVRDGLVDLDLIYPMIYITLFQWFKWKDVIEEQRKRYYTPLYLENWEYLVNEFIKYGEKIGYPWTPPATLSRYVPDQ